MPTETIGIIGGTGWVGGAVATAMLNTGFIDAGRLLLSNRSGNHPLADAGAALLASNQELVDASDTIIISVRPEQFGALNIQAPGKLVISLMAGVTADTVRTATGAATVVRAMVNAAAQIRQSFTPWYCAQDLPSAHRELVQRLFECVGTASQVPTEECIDYLSALSGTGPAFAALLMTALASQARAAGIPGDIAQQAAKSVVVGASQLLVENDPQSLIDSLMAYRGVTAAALQTMIDGHFEALIGRALEAGATVARSGM